MAAGLRVANLRRAALDEHVELDHRALEEPVGVAGRHAASPGVRLEHAALGEQLQGDVDLRHGRVDRVGDGLYLHRLAAIVLDMRGDGLEDLLRAAVGALAAVVERHAALDRPAGRAGERDVALEWTEPDGLEKYRDWLRNRLLSPTVKP